MWIEHHPFKDGTPLEPLVKVVWSAGQRHEVTTVSDDPSGRFAAVLPITALCWSWRS